MSVTTFVSGDTVRVVLEASEKVPFRVRAGGGPRHGGDPARPGRGGLPAGAPDGRHRGRRAVPGRARQRLRHRRLGRRFQQLKASEQDGAAAPGARVPGRAARRWPADAGRRRAAAPPPGGRPPAAQGGGLRTVVIDPGHGGAEVGAKGPGGTLEKDVTLAIARKLRAALANSLGLQAFLTRDKDQEVALDDRTAFANNYKADLFVSIHANASRATARRGSEVYFLSYQASDEESRRLAAGGGRRDRPSGAAAAGGLATSP